MSDPSALALQEQMIAFIRAFGLHRPEETPCGEPVSVAEAHALMELACAAPLSQTDLCTRLHLVKSTVSRVVSLLERRGWIERQRNPLDGRAVQVALTPTGQVAAGQLAATREAKFARLLERLPSADQPAVLRSLNILVEALRES